MINNMTSNMTSSMRSTEPNAKPLNQNGLPILIGDERPTALHDYPIVHVQTMAWGEMDAFNHLNNVVFYRYAESARISYLHHLHLFADDQVTLLARSSCDYLRPVFFPDTLLIGVRCQKLGNTSLTMEYTYFSQQQQQTVATAEAVIVRMDGKGEHKQPWTAEQRQAIMDFDASVGHVPVTS